MGNAERQRQQPEKELQPDKPDLKLVDNARDTVEPVDEFYIAPTEADLAENLEIGLDRIQSILNTKVDWDVTEGGAVKPFWQKDDETLEQYKERLGYRSDVQGKICALLGEELYINPHDQNRYFSSLAEATMKVCGNDSSLALDEIIKALDNTAKTGDIFNVYKLAIATTEGRDISEEIIGIDDDWRYGSAEGIQKGPLFLNAVHTIEALNEHKFIGKQETESALLEVIKRGAPNWTGDNLNINDRELVKNMIEDGIDEREYFGMDEYDDSPAMFESLELLKRVGSEKCVQPILDYVKTSEPNRLYYAAQALSKAAPEKAAQTLMKDLKSNSIYEKVLAEKLLLNLELGKIGISGEGVRYLNQLYDLGIFNKKGSFVQRLTNEGQIGVFDENSELMVYFPLQLDRKDSQDRIQAQIMKFTYESLFIPKEDETEEERAQRERILEDFKAKFSEVYLGDFEAKTGLAFNSFSLHDQGWFLEYVNNASEEEKDRAYSFLKEFRHEGLRAFLTMGYGSENGNLILDLSEKIDNKEFKKVLLQFTRLVETAERFRDLAESSIDNFEDFSTQAHEAILRRAKDIFLALDVVSSGNAERSENDVEDAFRSLNYALSSLSDLFNEGATLKQKQINKDGAISRRFEGENGDVINVFIRPEASDDGQARINFAVKPGDKHLKSLFTRTEIHNGRETQRSDIRIGFDLDVDRAGNVRGFSMDTGRSPYKSEIYTREGDVLGKMLELASEHKSHNYDSFNPRLSDPEKFREIAENLDAFLEHGYSR